MPRTAQEILDHADELAARFERAEPSDVRDATALQAVREAFLAIGAMVGTSGEAARQRYGQAVNAG